MKLEELVKGDEYYDTNTEEILIFQETHRYKMFGLNGVITFWHNEVKERTTFMHKDDLHFIIPIEVYNTPMGKLVYGI